MTSSSRCVTCRRIFFLRRGVVKAVDGVNPRRGEVLGLVGESGAARA